MNIFQMDLQKARPNQNVHLDLTDAGLKVILNQDRSTPGVVFPKTRLSTGAYEITLKYTSQSHNTFSICFFDEHLRDKKIRISNKIPMGSGEFSAKFTVNQEGDYIPAILASLGKIGDTMLIEGFFLTIEDVDNATPKEEEVKNTTTIVLPETISSPEAAIPTVVSVEKIRKVHTQIGGTTPYFLNTGNKHGLGSFLRNLKEIIPNLIILEGDEAIPVLENGNTVMTNGFLKSTEILAYKYKGQFLCFWHSSFAGSDMMAESGRLTNFLEAISNDTIKGFFLNPTEMLPLKAKKFWLPFTLDLKPDSNDHKKSCDFALPLGSPHSIICKNLLETIILLLSCNKSFIMPLWYKDLYKLDVLKQAFGSQSEIRYFDTKTFPIEKEYYSQAKFYLCLSHSDTMPYGCIEALQAGTPFIISPNVGWARFFEEKKDGFVVKNTKAILSFADANKLENAYERKSIWERQVSVLRSIGDINRVQLLKQLTSEGIITNPQNKSFDA